VLLAANRSVPPPMVTAAVSARRFVFSPAVLSRASVPPVLTTLSAKVTVPLGPAMARVPPWTVRVPVALSVVRAAESPVRVCVPLPILVSESCVRVDGWATNWPP